MTAPAPVQRVEALEAAAFRTGRDLTAVNDQLEAVNARLDLLSGAVNELSGDVRELRTDMTELHGKVDRLDERLGSVEAKVDLQGQTLASHGALLAAIARKLGVEDPGSGVAAP